jgi:hypothetical protein
VCALQKYVPRNFPGSIYTYIEKMDEQNAVTVHQLQMKIVPCVYLGRSNISG